MHSSFAQWLEGRERRGRRLVICVMVLAVGCVGLIASASAGVRATKPTLTFAGPVGCPTSISPAAGTDQLAGVRGASIVYEPLVKGDLRNLGESYGTSRPGLATSWLVYPGNKKIKLTLRKGVRFSDGELFDAEAVKTWIEFVGRDPRAAFVAAGIGPVARAEVLSKYVVLIVLKTPNPMIVGALQDILVPSPQATAQYAANPNSDVFNKRSYGVGPYMFDESQSLLGDHCTYVPNPLYYDKSRQKNWGKIVTRRIGDPNSLLAALQAGQVDVTYAGTALTADAAAAAGLNIIVRPGDGGAGGDFGIWLLDRNGVNQPALKDVRVRQALNYAVDRKVINAATFGRYGTPSSMCNFGAEGTDQKLVDYYDYNPAKARALLAAAGYEKGFTFSIVTTDAPLASTSPFWVPMAQAVAKYLAAVGVTMEIKIATAAEYGGLVASGKFSGYVSAFGRVPMVQWRGFAWVPGKIVGDQHGWRDPAMDKLWLKALRAGSKGQAQLWRQMQERCITQAYHLPILGNSLVAYANKSIGGIKIGNAYYDLASWYRK